MTQYTREQRIDHAEQAWREGRIIQAEWTRGQDLVCALAAFVPEVMGDPNARGGFVFERCSASKVMPRWLAGLIPRFDDGIDADDVHCFMAALLARARVWDQLSDGQWVAVKNEFEAGLAGNLAETIYRAMKNVDPGKKEIIARKVFADQAKRLFHIIDKQLGFKPPMPQA